MLSGAAAEQLLEGPGPSCGDSEVQALWEEEVELTGCGCVLSEVVGTTERSEDGKHKQTRMIKLLSSNGKYIVYLSILEFFIYRYWSVLDI